MTQILELTDLLACDKVQNIVIHLVTGLRLGFEKKLLEMLNNF